MRAGVGWHSVGGILSKPPYTSSLCDERQMCVRLCGLKKKEWQAGEVLTRYVLWQNSDRPHTKQALVAFFRIGEQPVWVILPVPPSFGGSERLPTARACATCAAALVIAALSDFETLNI